ncbi:MAG: hypothetical protein K2W95_08475 [Candidatus Obscuribacterales bacterium]|nr:hypothetical protein [Candidatus Obscuribacterales bacterium]
MANPSEIGLESVTKKNTESTSSILNLANTMPISERLTRVGDQPAVPATDNSGGLSFASPFKPATPATPAKAEKEAAGGTKSEKPEGLICIGDKCYLPGTEPKGKPPLAEVDQFNFDFDIVEDPTASAPAATRPDATTTPKPKDSTTPIVPETTSFPDFLVPELFSPTTPKEATAKPGTGPAEATPRSVDAAPLPKEVKASNGSIDYDDNCHVSEITYPGGRHRKVERQDEELKSLTTKDSEGTLKLVQRDGHWYAQTQGLETELKGGVEVDDSTGDVIFGTGKDTWRREKPDGSVKLEHLTANGARVASDEQKNVESVARKDGSAVRAVDSSTIVEEGAGEQSATVTWRKEGDQWKADGKEPRTNFQIKADGSVSYESAGLKHVLNDAGAHSVSMEGHATLHLDESGFIKGATTADGKHERVYDTFENTSDLRIVTLEDKTTGEKRTYTRPDKDSLSWVVTDEKGKTTGTWHGEVKLDSNGTHSVRSCALDSAGRPIRPAQNDVWSVTSTDGVTTKQQFNADNSRATLNGNDVIAFSGNGRQLELGTTEGATTIKISDGTPAGSTTWTRGADNQWRSDTKDSTEVRKNMKFTATGDLSYETEKGVRVTVHSDRSRVEIADKIALEYNAENVLTGSRKGDLQRTFVRENGQIQSVKDTDLRTKQEKVLFDRKPEGEETRSHVALSETGELSWQNADGTAVIERTDGLHVELDQAGDTTKVVQGDLSRDFKYLGEGEQKTLIEVKDTRAHGSSTYCETWTRAANEDGTLGANFQGKDSFGRDLPTRCGLTACADGEYEYRLPGDANDAAVRIARMTMPEVQPVTRTSAPVMTDRTPLVTTTPQVIERTAAVGPQCQGRVCDNRTVYRSQVEVPSSCPTMRPATPSCTPGGSCAPRQVGPPYYSGNPYGTSWSAPGSSCNSGYVPNRPVLNFIRGGRRR